MNTPLIVIHVVVSILIIFIVLLQVGRGAEAGAFFGGTNQVYSSRGRATFVGKLTTGLAVAFMLTSFTLTYTTTSKSKSSVIEKVAREAVVVDEENDTAVPSADDATSTPAGEESTE